MKHVLVKFRKDCLSGIVTGRADTSFFNGVFIDYFGKQTSIKAVANIVVVDAHTVIVTPFDKHISQEIERCMNSLGYECSTNESLIRVKMPRAIKPGVRDGVHQRLAKQARLEIENIVRETVHDISALPEFASVDLAETLSALRLLAQRYIAEIERDSDQDDDDNDSGPALVKR